MTDKENPTISKKETVQNEAEPVGLSAVERFVMGPPAPGPIINIQAPGIYLHLQVNDKLDLEILQLVILRAEQRRYAKAA